MAFELGRADVGALAAGAWILGTGGGGSPYLAQLNLERDLADGATVRVVAADELDDRATVAVVSTMGAPLVGQERLVDPDHLVRAVQVMEEVTGRSFDAVMPVEIGGGNALAPFLVSARTGLPVVDADAMGRAYPEQQMTSFSIGGLSPAPLAVVDARQNEAVIARAASWRWMERMSRVLCTELGSVAATCKAPRTAPEVREWGIHGSVSKALSIGRTVRTAADERRDPVQSLLDQEGGRRLLDGKVVDVERVTTSGFIRGTVTIDGVHDGGAVAMHLDFQNEWAVATVAGRPVCSTPDLICLLDVDSGEAIGTETVRYGQRVAVVALPPPAVLRTPRGLELVGPRAFGYEFDHVSVFG
ncbi:hypothetical protein B7486_54315 [cyanobacterium TDX16]|nr:hypothetical protein B7486_54315 [cyanobacterium TDX16]